MLSVSSSSVTGSVFKSAVRCTASLFIVFPQLAEGLRVWWLLVVAASSSDSSSGRKRRLCSNTVCFAARSAGRVFLVRVSRRSVFRRLCAVPGLVGIQRLHGLCLWSMALQWVLVWCMSWVLGSSSVGGGGGWWVVVSMRSSGRSAFSKLATVACCLSSWHFRKPICRSLSQ